MSQVKDKSIEELSFSEQETLRKYLSDWALNSILKKFHFSTSNCIFAPLAAIPPTINRGKYYWGWRPWPFTYSAINSAYHLWFWALFWYTWTNPDWPSLIFGSIMLFLGHYHVFTRVCSTLVPKGDTILAIKVSFETYCENRLLLPTTEHFPTVPTYEKAHPLTT